MKNRKIFGIILLFTMVLASFAACSGNHPSTPAATTNSTTSGETGTTDDGAAMLAAIPVQDFGGYVFHFISRRENDPEWTIWGDRDIYAEAENGDPINDAVFARNSYIEDAYNCGIQEYQSFDMVNDFTKAVKAGDSTYDVALPPLNQGVVLSSQGMLLNLDDISSIKLSNPWWDQNANASLSIDSKLYFTSGDLLILNNDSTGAFVFNKQMIQNYQLSDPYQMVENGTWTIDAFFAQAKQVSKDLDGDGQMTQSDRYGFMEYRDVMFDMLHGAGGSLGAKDSSDLPVLTYDSDQNIAILQKVFAIMNDTQNTFQLHKLYASNASGATKPLDAFTVGQNMFAAGQALYYWVRLRDVQAMRGMDADFGILPIPKWDDSQTNYYSTVNNAVATCITIPASCSDPGRAGLFLEALSCKSKYTLQPAYYDITLNGKVVRDTQSSEMLDIIFAHRIYDIALLGNFGGILETMNTMVDANNTNFTSQFAKIDSSAEKDMTRQIQKIENLNQ